MTTATTSKSEEIYEMLLQSGLWESFVEYMWGHANWKRLSGFMSATAWRDIVWGNENEKISALFAVSDLKIIDVVESFFKIAPDIKKALCRRCNSSLIVEKKDYCTICGWNFSVINIMEEEIAEKAIRVNLELNAQRVTDDIVYRIHCLQLKKLENDVTRLKELLQNLEKEEKETIGVIESMSNNIANNTTERKKLESKLYSLKTDFNELVRAIKATDSLYKQFEPLKHSLTLRLKCDGNRLLTTSHAKIRFPADLIIALKPVGVPGDVIRNASCFVVIKRKDWQKTESGQWFWALGSEIQPGDYHAEFSTLLNDGYEFKIEFNSKKITVQ